MDVTIRTIREDEFADYARAVELAFGSVPSDEDIAAERTLAELDRAYAAFDGDRIVGTAATFTMPMTIPGGEIPIGFVTAVGVRPSHRRRGVNTALMQEQLAAAHERDELVEALFATEGGIYGRFGYGLAALELSFDARTEHLGFVRGYSPSGTVRLVEREEATGAILAIHENTRLRVPGMPALDRTRFDYVMRGHDLDRDRPFFFALHEGDDGPDGFATYRIRHEWRDGVPASTLTVRDLQASATGAYADLWRYVFDMDLIGTVGTSNRPADEPLLHLLRDPRRLGARLGDGLWLRVVDVSGALAARRYSAPGRVVIEVTDPMAPWNDGRFALEVDADGSAVCAPTTEEPSIACSVSELGAAYLGGMSFRRLARAGLVDEHLPEALASADAMFAWDPAPWCPYVF